MPLNEQVIFSSDASGQMWNTNVWDIQTGTSIMCYKGGSTAPRTLALVKGDYLIGAANNRPLLHVWALQRRDQMQLKMILPGKVGSLAVSPDGCYCVASISEQIHVWQVCTGELVAILHRHYQQISCLKFSDSSTFVSGGDDSLVLVWCLGSILADDSDLNARIEPKFVWADHSLPITDIHVGFGGIRSRLASSSLDQTCKIWDMNSGHLLCSFLFSISITAVTMDPAEYHLFAGGCSGHIFKCNLFERPVRVERHIDSLENDVSDSFTGHDKQVSCLCVSQDGALVSGSHDFTVKIWDVFSGQCLRTFLHKGIVTNVFVLDLPWAVLNPGHKPNQPISPFRRHLHSAGDDQSEEGLQTSHHFVCVNLQESEEVMGSVLEQPTGELKQELTALSKEKLKLEDKTAFLKNTNLRLFKIFANRILKM